MKPPSPPLFVAALALVGAGFLSPQVTSAQLDDELVPGHSGGEGSDYGWEETDGPVDPLRIVTSLTFGTSVRFIRDLDFSQDYFAPAYIDLFGGVVLPGNDLRHSFWVLAALNVTGDGPSNTVEAGSQLVLGGSYGLYIPLNDFLIFPKFSVPVSLTPSVSLGFELSVGAAYRLLAGFGIYAELAASIWIGAATSIHPLGSGELGVIIDYEVLP